MFSITLLLGDDVVKLMYGLWYVPVAELTRLSVKVLLNQYLGLYLQIWLLEDLRLN